MRFVFFATPDYTLPIVKSLYKAFKNKVEPAPITAVVTQPPRPTGRKKILTYSPIDNWAHKRKIPIFYTTNSSSEYDEERILTAEKIKELGASAGILAAFGQILPETVIKSFPFGILNIHPSLLPQFRGASPVQATITTGAKPGVSIIKLDDKLDHCPIVTRFTDETKEGDTTKSLRDRLFSRSAEVLVHLIDPYVKGKVNIKKQNHEKATYTSLIKKDHGFVPWKQIKLAMSGKSSKDEWNIAFIKDYQTIYSPRSIERYIRAMSPWPGVWTLLKENGEEKRLKLLQAALVNTAGKSKLILKNVQLEGKNPTDWQEFKRGYKELID